MTFFDRIYREQASAYGELPDAFLAKHVAPAEGTTALDAGGGAGRNALWLARQGYRVELFDASKVAVEAVRARAAAEGLPLEAGVADLRGWHPERTYDLVVCAITLHVFKQHRAEAIAAVLREAVTPGGRFFLSLHLAGGAEQRDRENEAHEEIEPRTYLWNGHHKRLFSQDEAHALLGWPPVAEQTSADERCPRAECPFVHAVYRGIARRPG